jgi:hypothetical protein
MVAEVPVSGVRAADRWIALVDQAERLRRHPDAYQRKPTSPQVGKAIDSVFAYEHQLTPATRKLARERLWLRDRPAEPLPLRRDDWVLCRCRDCQRARRLKATQKGG